MSKKKTTVEFINEAKQIHNEKYDYSQVNYIDNKTKINIICPIHGLFKQSPISHLQNIGCKQCSNIKKSNNMFSNINIFIDKANQIHGNKYDYSLVNYNGSQSQIKIICPIHGLFEQQTPNSHLKGRGCPNCGLISRTNRRTFTTDIFIEKANQVHNNKYNYTKTKYIKKDIKVKIICPIHGEFEQIPNDHLRGTGCKKCSFSEHNGGWTTSNWINAANESKYFDSFKVYVIECWNDEERFIKIGRTFTTVEQRFHSKHDLPYNYKILKIIENPDYMYIFNLENKLKRKFKDFKYLPTLPFGGQYECYCKWTQ